MQLTYMTKESEAGVEEKMNLPDNWESCRMCIGFWYTVQGVHIVSVDGQDPEVDPSQPVVVRCRRGHDMYDSQNRGRSGWCCDGGKERGGCVEGKQAYGNPSDIPRWRCDECDWDYCQGCYERAKRKQQDGGSRSRSASGSRRSSSSSRSSGHGSDSDDS
eukprot:GDKI01022201.1.p1 GENE.GDKI01022201.1~~GDKI01022201.1.p1  ORF type:complete len:160 (-),score=44.92 GDKI01022201.1:17-496(-)